MLWLAGVLLSGGVVSAAWFLLGAAPKSSTARSREVGRLFLNDPGQSEQAPVLMGLTAKSWVAVKPGS